MFLSHTNRKTSSSEDCQQPCSISDDIESRLRPAARQAGSFSIRKKTAGRPVLLVTSSHNAAWEVFPRRANFFQVTCQIPRPLQKHVARIRSSNPRPCQLGVSNCIHPHHIAAPSRKSNLRFWIQVRRISSATVVGKGFGRHLRSNFQKREINH